MQGPAPSSEQLGAEQRIALLRDGGVVDELYTAVSMLSDHETLVVTAPLDAELAAAMSEVDAVVRVDSRGDAHPLDLAALQVDHAVTLDIAR
jgi:hypothetical protein